MKRNWVRGAVVGAWALIGAATAYAQSTTSGIDPSQVLQGMTPDQQQQILQRLSGMGGTSNSAGTGQPGTTTNPDQESRANQTEQNGAQNRTRKREGEEEEQPSGAPPVFKSEDSVVVEVDTQPLKPRPIDTFSAAAASGYNGQLQAGQLQQLQQMQQLQALQQTQPSALQNQNQGQTQNQNQQDQDQPAPLTDQQKQRLTNLVDLIRLHEPYTLSRQGVLELPGVAGIPLAGLTELQATLRLEVDPMLEGLHFRLTRLPLKKVGLEGLKPFGYDLFNHNLSTFAPVTNIPVPADYVVGAGDELEVQLYGNQNGSYRLTVDRDGRVTFPQLGPINVGGQRFISVKEELEQRVARQMIGVKASVSMADTRAIRVFVLGEAQVPGSYTISGLGTITSALYAAGGIKRIGSLRDIQLKRQGTIVRHLDLYDLLIHGDTADDAKLLPGDVVFVPPIGETASADGEVKRPAIYEIHHGATVADLVQLAGGLTPDADARGAMLNRIEDNGTRRVLAVDLDSRQAVSGTLSNGDLLRVSRLRPTLDSAVHIQGYVFAPGAVAFRPGMRLLDVLPTVDALRPDADLHYVLIRREVPPDRHIVVRSADFAAAVAQPDSAANVPLAARDEITVFDLQSGRDRIIRPLMDELRMQSSMSAPAHVVRVDGRVRVPGQYPLEQDMRVSDLIRAGGSLSDSAFGGRAELARYAIINGETRQTELIPIDLAAVMRGDPKANILLEPFDSLSIKEISLWGEQEQVILDGQVKFPGTYSIKHGETLKSVLARAGGLTQYAFPEGSVFTRVELQQREQDQLNFLGQRMQTDIATMALEATAGAQLSQGNGSGAAGALAIGQTLLSELRSSRAVGRLVIDLPRLMQERMGSEDDVILRNGDHLIVPRYQQEVTVIGEVQSVTSHLYRTNLTRDDYIALSGGLTRHADAKRIYVVRANGSVVANSSHFFRVNSEAMKIHPGDTIVVPLNTEQLPPLPMWEAITTILYNIAVSVAAVHSLSL
ncbi:MAG TPA: SLBB domain-containing protein [Steroidobacteraceae bacterium]